MEINKELVRHVAEVARLKLTEEEVETFVPQFKEILDLFSELDKIDTEGIEPSFRRLSFT